MTNPTLSIHQGVSWDTAGAAPHNSELAKVPPNSVIRNVSSSDPNLTRISGRNPGLGQAMRDHSDEKLAISSSLIPNPTALLKSKNAPTPELIETLKENCDLHLMKQDRAAFSQAMSARATRLVFEKFQNGSVVTPNQFKRCYNQAVREFLVESGLYGDEVAALAKIAGSSFLSVEAREKLEKGQASIDALLTSAFQRSLDLAWEQMGAINGLGPSRKIVSFLTMLDNRLHREPKQYVHKYRSLSEEFRVQAPFISRNAHLDEKSFWVPSILRKTLRPHDEHGAFKIARLGSMFIPIVPVNHFFNEELGRKMLNPLQGVHGIIEKTSIGVARLVSKDAEQSVHTLRFFLNNAKSDHRVAEDSIEISAIDDDSLEVSALGEHRVLGETLNEAFNKSLANSLSNFNKHAAKLEITSASGLIRYIENTNNSRSINLEKDVAAGELIQGLEAELRKELENGANSHATTLLNLLDKVYGPQNYKAVHKELKTAIGTTSPLSRLANLPDLGRFDPSAHKEICAWIDAARHLGKYRDQFTKVALYKESSNFADLDHDMIITANSHVFD